jgi:hypothetical protein
MVGVVGGASWTDVRLVQPTELAAQRLFVQVSKVVQISNSQASKLVCIPLLPFLGELSV